MPQNFFEPRTPVVRRRPPGLAPAPGGSGVGAGGPGGDGRPEEDDPPPAGGAGEPSWARIYWNTLRSFTRRTLGLGPLAPRGQRPHRGALLAGVAALLVLALVTLLVVTRGQRGVPAASGPNTTRAPAHAGRPAAPDGSRGADRVRDTAAVWVAENVGSGRVVACDAAVCAALEAHGFPAASTITVESGTKDLLGADVAVVTGPVRALTGAALTDLTGPEPLAAFGTGAQRADVLPVAHAGRAAFERGAATARADRRAAGAALADNRRITFGAGTRALLTGGHVDPRVCALLAVLAGEHPLTVRSFGAPAPGAGRNAVRTAVEISATGGGRHARALRALVAAQRPPYRPLHTSTRAGAGRSPSILTVRYAQPAPGGATP